MAQVSASFDLLAVDDFYFSLVFDQNLDETEPISDSKYAEELQLQETLVASSIASQTSSVITLLAAIAPPPESINIIVGQSSQDVCEICVERKEPEEMFRSGTCDHHSYCIDCVTKYVAVRLQDNVSCVHCPADSCTSELRLDDCRPLLPKSVLERWEDVLCESMIPESKKFYCPFRDCSGMLVIEDDDGAEIRESECPYCHRLFCAKCHVPWHVGIDCDELQKLDEDERGRDDLLVRELAKEKLWGRCPQCKFYVERTEGCPHITCRCSFEFCYGCGTAWTADHGGCAR